jgi:hypothetical protein
MFISNFFILNFMKLFSTSWRYTYRIFKYSNFKEVCEVVIQRAKELPKHQLVMFWHHCYLEAFEYLSFKRQ